MPRTTQELAIEIAKARELLQIQRSNLHLLRVQEANFGGVPPLYILNQIAQIEGQIGLLDVQIAQLEREANQVAQTESRAMREQQLIEALRVQRTRAEGITTARPLALAICLIPSLGSIKVDVAAYLQAQGWAMPVDELAMAGINDGDDVARLVVALQAKKQALQDAGYTEIHLFMAGPIMAGVAVGGIFDNWKPIKLYHRAADNTYEYWMPLIGT